MPPDVIYQRRAVTECPSKSVMTRAPICMYPERHGIRAVGEIYESDQYTCPQL